MSESINNDEVVRVLKNVVDALGDSQKGFADLGEHLTSPQLKEFFAAESLRRASYRGELESELHHAGVKDVKDAGTTVGAIHRIWGDLKAKVISGDHEILVTAEQGEDAAKKAYADALEQPLPFPIKQLLVTQRPMCWHRTTLYVIRAMPWRLSPSKLDCELESRVAEISPLPVCFCWGTD